VEISELIVILIMIAIFIGLQVFFIRIAKEKVNNYLVQKYHNYRIESIKWTLFGPFAPGKNNYKFATTLIERKTNHRKEIYAVSSIFGSVYIHE